MKKIVRAIFETLRFTERDNVALLMRIGLVLYAIALILSVYNGSAIIPGDEWRGFVEKMNWFLYFLFFPILGGLTLSNWNYFVKAWSSLPRKRVLLEKLDGGRQAVSSAGVRAVINDLIKLRRWFMGLAIAVGLLLTTVDSTCTATFNFPNLYDSLPTFFQRECTRSIDDADKKKFSFLLHATSDAGGMNTVVKLVAENDFSILHLELEGKTVSPNNLPGVKLAGFILVVVIYLMQAVIISIAFLLLFQIYINLYKFTCLAVLPFRKESKLGIFLNFEDKMAEFGLADWNNAINYTNVIVAIGMAIPVISAQSQPEKHDDVGQILLMLLLPLLFTIPILWSFSTRVILQLRFKRDFDKLTDAEKNSYKDQALWPFDRDIISKVTIGIIAAEYYFVATNLPEGVKTALSIFRFG